MMVLDLADVPDALIANIGGKARGLVRMLRTGLPVPPGFVVLPDASVDQITAAYLKLGGTVIVRSSAHQEDGPTHSFAGLQTSHRDITNLEALQQAIQDCRQATTSPRLEAYRVAKGLPKDMRAIGVIVQRQVEGVNGVLFTVAPDDPMTMLAETVTGDCHRWPRQAPPTGLATLAMRCETLFGQPQDVEWVRDDDTIWLVQSRPITTNVNPSKHHEIQRLQSIPAVWAMDSLAAELPAPKPLTWDIWQTLLRTDGGLGELARDLGAYPDRDHDTSYGLVAGRVHVNLLTLPKMQFRSSPFCYPVEQYRKNAPSPDDLEPTLAPLNLAGWLALPRTAWRLYWMQHRLQEEIRSFVDHYRLEVAPAFRTEALAAWQHNHTRDEAKTLLTRLQEWTTRTLRDFARESLKPAVFAQYSRQKLIQQLQKTSPQADIPNLLLTLSAGLKIPEEADLTGGLRRLMDGRWQRPEFLEHFGHRGPSEYDFWQPRYAEEPDQLPTPSTDVSSELTALEARLREGQDQSVNDRLAALFEDIKRSPQQQRELRIALETWRNWLVWREVARNDLARGFAVIRRILLALQAKLDCQHLPWLTMTELTELVNENQANNDWEARRREWDEMQTWLLPKIIFPEDLRNLGRTMSASSTAGTPISPGVAWGEVFRPNSPSDKPMSPDYVLILPDADPTWFPLMVTAKAVIFARASLLSHAAILVRELGIPAVANLDITKLTGTVTVNGSTGEMS
jgi:rifampicin phosphotransferase